MRELRIRKGVYPWWIFGEYDFGYFPTCFKGLEESQIEETEGSKSGQILQLYIGICITHFSLAQLSLL